MHTFFAPLHMDATIDLDTIPDGSTALATGYTQTALAGLEPAAYEGPGWSLGSGQVVTTAQDVALWEVAFLHRQVLPPKQADEEITLAHLADASTYPSALGLFVFHDLGITRYYHTGEGLGFQAVNMIYPDQSLAIVVLTNTNVTSTYLKIANELIYLLMPPSIDEKLAQTIFVGLESGNLDETALSPDLKQYLTPMKLRECRSSLTPLGAVESFSLAHTQTIDGLTTTEYDVIAGGQKLRLHLLFLPNHKIEDVAISREW
jgi:CubicO group peptidase (beta-lactamase class C family)